MKYSALLLSVLLSLADAGATTIEWTGNGDNISLFQEANWQIVGGGPVLGNPLAPSAIIAEDLIFTGLAPNVSSELRLGALLHIDGGTLTMTTSGGMNGGTVSITNGGALNADWANTTTINISQGTLTLRGGGNPLSSSTIVCSGTQWSIVFANETSSAVQGEHLGKITIDGQPALVGFNCILTGAGGTGSSLAPSLDDRDIDSDGDGLSDAWELAYFTDLGQNGSDDLPDLDGLDNAGEQERGTNPTLADTDGDGLSDKVETGTGNWVDAKDTGTDPLSPDSDADGLPDGVETRTSLFVNGLDTGTDPLVPNSDGDRIADGAEVARGADPTNPASQPKLPNVLFIMADDMGYNHLSCYGQQRIQTPHIDSLATAGLRFTNAYAGGAVCGPSRSSLMSGLHSGHIPVQRNAGYTDITDRTITLGEVFKKAGYATGYFGKWGLGGPDSGQTPNDRGFDEFLGMLDHGHGHIHYPHYLDHNKKHEPTGNTTVPGRISRTNPDPAFRVQHTHDAFSNAALQFIDDHQGEAFFCFLSFTLPHTEIIATPAAVGDITKNTHPVWNAQSLNFDNYTATTDVHFSQSKPHTHFAAELRMIDNTVGAIVAKLDTLGLANNTLVIFTSDNGGQLQSTWGNAPGNFFEVNKPLRGGKANVYEGGLRVPFIAKWPGRVAAGTTSNLPHYFADMLPTMCEIVGTSAPAYTDGLSILPTLTGDHARQKRHRYMCWLEQGTKRAIRAGPWKAVKNGGNAIELYDLDTDPSETRNVAGANPAIVREMQNIMDREYTPELPVSERPSANALRYRDFPQ